MFIIKIKSDIFEMFKKGFVFLLPLSLFAQMTVSGTVSDAATGNALAGANVVVEGTDLGAAAAGDGSYSIANVPAGATITASMIGYANSSATAAATVNFALEAVAIQLSALEVLASRADEKTPVAYTNVTKAEMEFRLGSQDIPMSLNTTPSVYATQQGGGAGDTRINVRGFNQRNVAVMINGVPQNDMENGWVYWSNWDGVGDATSSIQMQRGLSAVNLATPSIGGTMNILTDPTAHSRGGKFKQEIGAGGFKKSTLNLNTGMIGGNFAFSTTIVRKTGDGIIDKTWTDAWAYYFGASYQMDETNRFELYAIGAPQRHGQNLYKQNIGAYDSDFAKSLEDYDQRAIFKIHNTDSTTGKFSDTFGRFFNQNWSPIDPSYNIQYWYMYGIGGLFGGGNQDRYATYFLNERENYFHKPLVNLNWYRKINEQMKLSSIFYWSGGSGGGTGTYGSISRNMGAYIPVVEGFAWYAVSPWTWDWNTTIQNNSTNIDSSYSTIYSRSTGILRNSINRQWTIGAISKMDYIYNDELKFQYGLDWRTATIEHAREVRDLLGGDYYLYTGNDFDNVYDEEGVLDEEATLENQMKKLGDIIAYHNTNTVDWLGFFGQSEYKTGYYSVYGMYGFSTIKYTFTDHFTDDGSGKEFSIETAPIASSQLKMGGIFNLSAEADAFVNYGNVQKVPIFDAVIDDNNGTVASDPANEIFISFEAGLNYKSPDGKTVVKANYYETQWFDRTLTKNVEPGQGSSGDTDIIFLKGLDQTHIGFEIEAAYQPLDILRIDGAYSSGTWEFDDDASGSYKDYINDTTYHYSYAVDGLKVGDMPQQSSSLAISFFPIKGLSIQAILNSYNNHYADWDPLSRQVYDWGDDGIEKDDSNDDGDYDDDDDIAPDNGEGDGLISPMEMTYADREESWMAPGYSKTDIHVTYDVPINPMLVGGVNIQAFIHIFNLFDKVYIQDATDNSKYNSWDNDHDADDAEVFLGIPRYFNAGITVHF